MVLIPPSFTLILNLLSGEFNGEVKNLLKGDIGVVLRFRSEAFRALQALRSYANLTNNVSFAYI